MQDRRKKGKILLNLKSQREMEKSKGKGRLRKERLKEKPWNDRGNVWLTCFQFCLEPRWFGEM